MVVTLQRMLQMAASLVNPLRFSAVSVPQKGPRVSVMFKCSHTRTGAAFCSEWNRASVCTRLGRSSPGVFLPFCPSPAAPWQ